MRALFFALFVLPCQVWAVDHFVCGVGRGAADGSSLENCWNNTVTWGTAAGQVGRGDALYVCGTEAEPVTATLTPAFLGPFDNVANALSDILIIDGDAAKCGGEGGFMRPAAGQAINSSGVTGIHIQNLTCLSSPGDCVRQIISNTTAQHCTSANGFYCGLHKNITCYNVAQNNFGHCSSIITSGNNLFPAVAIEGLLQEDITSYDGGGAACNLRMHALRPVQRRCKSYRDGKFSNVWGVYQAGVTFNIGITGGTGVPWTLVSGTVHKVTQTGWTGTSTGQTIIDVYSPVVAEGVVGRLVKDAGCVTDDATCAAALSAGEFGQIGDVLYVNIGAVPTCTSPVLTTFCNNRAMYVTYAWNTGGLITESFAEDFRDTYDGVGIGLDFGVLNGVIEQSYARRSASYDFACGGGSVNCIIRSSISGGVKSGGSLGNGAVRLSGNHTLQNFSAGGDSSAVVKSRVHAGETVTLRNIASSIETLNVSDGADGDDGAVVQVTNDVAADFVEGPSPKTAEGFRPRAGSRLIRAGTFAGPSRDFSGRPFAAKPSIGAFEVERGTQSIRR